jgi:predicted RND superfamily exporter protein
MDSISNLLEQGLKQIDDAEEQAFSSGHSEIVKDLEVTRTRLDEILTIIRAQPDQARERTQALLSAIIASLHQGLDTMAAWAHQEPLTPSELPASIHDRFIAKDGTVAVYAFPAQSVYNPDNLDRLVQEVYSVSPEATGFPTTHQVFSKAVVSSFSKGTLMAVGLVLVWLLVVLRKPKSFILAALPLLIGGGWMLGLMAIFGLHYNYANIIALPLVIALAVDYGVWYSHRWGALEGHSPLEITLNAGKVIALAAGTEFAGLGAITLASYRGVSSLGIDISLGLITCLVSTFLIAPAIGQMLDRGKKPIPRA